MPRTKEQNREIREKTKKVILDSAIKLFAEKGFQATSMSDIAKLAGVSKGLAYNYFDSKRHIVEAILKYVTDLMYKLYRPVLEEKDPYDKLEKLSTLWKSYLTNFCCGSETTIEFLFF